MCASSDEVDPGWAGLPQDVLAAVLKAQGSDRELVAACRLVCHGWRSSLDATIDSLDLTAWPQQPRFLSQFPALKRVSCIKAACTTSQPPAAEAGTDGAEQDAVAPGSAAPAAADAVRGGAAQHVHELLGQLAAAQPTAISRLASLSVALHVQEAQSALRMLPQLSSLTYLTVAGLPPPDKVSTDSQASTHATHGGNSTSSGRATGAGAPSLAELATQLHALTARALHAEAVLLGVAPMPADGPVLQGQAPQPAPAAAAHPVGSEAPALTAPGAAAAAAGGPAASSTPTSSTGSSTSTSHATARSTMALGSVCSLPGLHSLQVLNATPDYATLQACSSLRRLEVSRQPLPVLSPRWLRRLADAAARARAASEATCCDGLDAADAKAAGTGTAQVLRASRPMSVSMPGTVCSTPVKAGGQQGKGSGTSAAGREGANCANSRQGGRKWVQGKLSPHGLSLRGVGQLGQLRELHMSRAQHSWYLPADLTLLTGLQVLDVSRNCLAHLPADLGNLACLTRLDITCCCLQELPESVSRLVGLQQLQAGGNPGLQFPPGATCLTSLTHLDLSWSSATNVGQLFQQAPDSFQRLAHLNLRGADVAALPPCLPALTALTTLILAGNPHIRLPTCNSPRPSRASLPGLTWWRQPPSAPPVPGGLAALPQLAVLDLSMCELSALPASVALPTSLTQLDLHANRLSALPADTLARLQQLTCLDVSANMLRALPECIARLPRLTDLRTALNPLLEEQ